MGVIFKCTLKMNAVGGPWPPLNAVNLHSLTAVFWLDFKGSLMIVAKNKQTKKFFFFFFFLSIK